MNFETWWNLSGASVIHKEPKDAARDAWQAAYMQACADNGKQATMQAEE